MQYIQFELSHDNFYCPATGECISSDKGINEQVASVQAIWTLETLEKPVFKSDELASKWQNSLAEMDTIDGIEGDDIVGFLKSYAKPNWLCVRLSSKGLPASDCWIVIDMDFQTS